MKNCKARKVRITGLHEADAFYKDAKVYIGLTGTFYPSSGNSPAKGYYSGIFKRDVRVKGYLTQLYFYGCRYVKI